MSEDYMDFYQQKLAYEMDSADLNEALQNSESIVVVDGRSDAASLTSRQITFGSGQSRGGPGGIIAVPLSWTRLAHRAIQISSDHSGHVILEVVHGA